MKKAYCDHCKKEISVNRKNSIELKYGCTTYAPVCYYELCDNCVSDLKKWFDETEDDNDKS